MADDVKAKDTVTAGSAQGKGKLLRELSAAECCASQNWRGA